MFSGTTGTTITTGAGPYVVYGDASVDHEGTCEYLVYYRDLGYFESGRGALRVHDGCIVLFRGIILGNHFDTDWPVNWPVGLKAVEVKMAAFDEAVMDRLARQNKIVTDLRRDLKAEQATLSALRKALRTIECTMQIWGDAKDDWNDSEHC